MISSLDPLLASETRRRQAIRPLPFWIGKEDDDQLREILSRYTTLLRVRSSNRASNSRKPIPFISRLSRHFTWSFESLVSVDEFVVAETTLLPIGKALPQLFVGWSRTLWSSEDGLPTRTVAIQKNEAASAVASSGATPSATDHVYCQPVWSTSVESSPCSLLFAYSHEGTVRDPGFAGQYAKFIARTPWPGDEIRNRHLRNYSPPSSMNSLTSSNLQVEDFDVEERIVETSRRHRPLRRTKSAPGWLWTLDDEDDYFIDDYGREDLEGDDSDSDDEDDIEDDDDEILEIDDLESPLGYVDISEQIQSG